jgi:uncharacterized protein YacL
MLKLIKQYPMLVGVGIGVLIVGFILVTGTWFPWVLDAWTRNNPLVRSVYFTIVFFAVFVAHLARQRHRNPIVFWTSVGTFFVLHVAFVVFYSFRIHPILMKEWILIILVESFVLVFGVDLAMRNVGKSKGTRRVA